MWRTGATAVAATVAMVALPGVGSPPASAQVVPAPAASPFYKISVVADAAVPSLFSRIGDSVSINDKGTVAFAASIAGGDGVFIADGSGPPTNVASAFLSPTRSFGEAVQINNRDQVLALSRKRGFPATYQLYRFDTPNSGFTQIATGGPNFSPFEEIFSHSSLNDSGNTVFGATCPITKPNCLSPALVTPKVEGSSNPEDFNVVPLPGTLRPLMANDGRIVVKDGTDGSIRLFNSDLDRATSVAIACQTGCAESGFTRLGSAPGIDDTGKVVVFVGDKDGKGLGIFASVDEGANGRRLVPVTGQRWNGIACIPPVNVDPIGYLGFDVAANNLTCFRDFQLDARVSVAVRPGGDDFVVSFIGMPSRASAPNPALPAKPLLFTDREGLFTVDMVLMSELAGVNQVYVPKGPRKVMQVGDVVGGRTVKTITLHDPLTIPSTDDAGAARAPHRGDHRLAFHVATDSDDVVLRASHLDTDEDGLLDHWETEGIDMDGDGVVDLDLPAMGANPARRDLFLEIDWLADANLPTNRVRRHELAPGTTDRLVKMFAEANKPIALHLDAGPGNDRSGQPFSRGMGGPLRGGDRIGVPGSPNVPPDIVYFEDNSALTPVPDVAALAFRAVKDEFMLQDRGGASEKGARELAFHYAVNADFGGYSNDEGELTLTSPLRDAVGSARNSPDPSLTMKNAVIPPGPNNAPFNLTGKVVKIIGNCRAAGQLRVVASNTATELTLLTPWAVVPDPACSFVLLHSRSGQGEILTFDPPNSNSLPGNDLLVTLGALAQAGTPVEKLEWRTLAHELGHNLALRHCGFIADANACKQDRSPNGYLSLMSYAHQLWLKSPVDSYSNEAFPFNDWDYVQLDFQNSPLSLGNTFLFASGAQLDDDEMTLSDYYEANTDSDVSPPTASVISPAPGTNVAVGSAFDVSFSTSDDAQVDSAIVAFDMDGDGTVDDPGETVTATGTGPGTFKASFAGISGPLGERTVLVSAVDATGNTGLSTVPVTVTDIVGGNDPPSAVDDTAATNEDAPLVIPVATLLANDLDPNGDPLTVTAVNSTPNTHGAVALADGTVTYTPAPDYNGPAEFTYTIDDGRGGTAAANVTVTIGPVNDPPTAVDDSYATDEELALTVPAPGVLANDTDPDLSDTRTAVPVSGPANGALTLNADGSFLYKPNPNFSGTDSFRYQAKDAAGTLSNEATATITVRPVNDPPVCAPVKADPSRLWPPDHTMRLVTLSGAVDPEGEPVRITITTVTQDEPLNGQGDGNTAFDAQRTSTSPQVFLRAERSGKGDGRVYRVRFTATDLGGASCSEVVRVGVPKSEGGGGSNPVESALVVNSFGG